MDRLILKTTAERAASGLAGGIGFGSIDSLITLPLVEGGSWSFCDSFSKDDGTLGVKKNDLINYSVGGCAASAAFFGLFAVRRSRIPMVTAGGTLFAAMIALVSFVKKTKE